MSRWYPCASSFRVASAVAVLAAGGSSAWGAESALLETYNDTLRTYQYSGTTGVQHCRPYHGQRGVFLDGELRSAPLQPWSIAANPYGWDWDGRAHRGDLRLDLGSYAVMEVDLDYDDAKMPWRIGRSYNALQVSGGQPHTNDGYQGALWFQMSQPELVFYDDATSAEKDVIYLVYGADRYIEFKRSDATSDEFKAKNGAAGMLLYDDSTSPSTYTYYDQLGTRTVFFGFNTTGNTHNGQIWKITDTAGNTAYVGATDTPGNAISSGYDSSGRIEFAYDSTGRRFVYSYDYIDEPNETPLNDLKRLISVVAEEPFGIEWEEVGRVDYYYYGADATPLVTGESHGFGTGYGATGDLLGVRITEELSTGDSVQEKYYRYWDDASVSSGRDHLLKYILGYEGARRLDWEYGATPDHTFDRDYLAAIDTELESYAESYFEYDASDCIVEAWFNGECGCSGGINGTYQYEYESSGYADGAGYDEDEWATRTTITRPDGAYEVQYFDEVGQPLTHVVSATNPDSASTFWVTHVDRNSNGVLTSLHTPENVTAYYHAAVPPSIDAGDVTLSTTAGLVWEYTLQSTGDMAGFVTARKWSKGDGATLNDYRAWTHTSTFVEPVTSGDVRVVRPLIASASEYPSTSAITTSYAYTFHSTTDTEVKKLAVATETTTYPAVSTANNGSGSATSESAYYNDDGTIGFAKSTEGIITYWEYTDGELTKRVDDANTSLIGVTPPSGFASATGDEFHRVTEYGDDTTTNPDGQQPYAHTIALADRRVLGISYPHTDDSSSPTKYYGPAKCAVMNHAGVVEFEAVVAFSGGYTTSSPAAQIDETQTDGLAAIAVGTVSRMVTKTVDDSGLRVDSVRSYFDTPASLPGTDGTHYDETTYGYGDLGNVERTVTPDGTITRSVLDSIGRAYQTWVGTNDADVVGTDNMVKVQERVFDEDGVGNSLVTSEKRHTNSSAYIEAEYVYDTRGNAIVVKNELPPHQLHKYDNLGRLIATGQYSDHTYLDATSDAASLTSYRLALTQTFYDELGQVYKSQRHKIDYATGANEDNLQTLNWYDDAGRLVKTDGEQLVKTAYDRIGRRTDVYLLANCSDDSTHAHALDVSGDIVLQEGETVYESTTSDDVVMQIAVDRLYSDYGSGETTGELDSNDYTTSPALSTSNDEVKGRVQITAYWYDMFGRVETIGQYGTNSSTLNVYDFTWADVNEPSASGAGVLVSKVAYNDDGSRQSTTDPAGIESRTLLRDDGRPVALISNYVDGAPSGDTDQFVRMSYTDGHMVKRWVDLDGDGVEDADDQVTIYTYGVETTDSPGPSSINANSLLREITYPDSADSTDVVLYGYNAAGSQIYARDQEDTAIETTYDAQGRLQMRAATALGTDIDGSVRRITYGYDNLGRQQTVTQYDSVTGGSVVNEVKNTFDDWGNLIKLEQDDDSTVATGGNYLHSVQWAYAKATTGRKTLRRTGMTLPDGDSISYVYSAVGSLHDAEASRVSKVMNGLTTLAEYEYNGVGTVVTTSLPEPDLERALHNGSTSFEALDQFNRLVTDRWNKVTPDIDFFECTIGYDDASKIEWVDDEFLPNRDNLYTMDGLHRLIDADRGTRSGSTISSRQAREQWTLSQTGNWEIHKRDLDGDGAWSGANELNDDATFNLANELETRDIDDDGTPDYTLDEDDAGQLTDDGENYKYIYDAFGRLVEIMDRSDDTVALYTYNGLGYRTSVTYDTDVDGDTDQYDQTYHHVYDDQWRVVATYRGTDSDPKEQFVHHNAGLSGRGSSSYIDDVVCRDKDANTAWTAASDGTLEERIYYCQNHRHDVSVLLDDSGALLERVFYSPYGVPFLSVAGDADGDGDCDQSDFGIVLAAMSTYDETCDFDLDGDCDQSDLGVFLAANGSSHGWGMLSSSDVQNWQGFAGYHHDEAIDDICHVRTRVLLTQLGRWTRRDPVGYADGMGLYEYVASEPLGATDPWGLMKYVGASASTGCGSSDSWDPGLIGPPTPSKCEQSCEKNYDPYEDGDLYSACLVGCKCQSRPSAKDCHDCCSNELEHGDKGNPNKLDEMTVCSLSCHMSDFKHDRTPTLYPYSSPLWDKGRDRLRCLTTAVSDCWNAWVVPVIPGSVVGGLGVAGLCLNRCLLVARAAGPLYLAVVAKCFVLCGIIVPASAVAAFYACAYNQDMMCNLFLLF